MAAPSATSIGLAASGPEQRDRLRRLLAAAGPPAWDLHAFSSNENDAIEGIRSGGDQAYLIDASLAGSRSATDAALVPSPLLAAAVATGRPVIILARDARCSAFLDAGAWDCLADASLTPERLAGALTVALRNARRLEAERTRLHEQKMDAIARFAGRLAHDFNNLLTVMLGYAQMLHESLDEHDARLEDMAELQRAGARAAALTRQLLTFGLRHPDQPRLLELNAIVDRLSAILPPLLGEGVRLDVRAEERLDPILGDEALLELLIVNLARNARDAMLAGGRLRIETAMATVTDAEAMYRLNARPGRHVVLVVADEGTGMTPEVMSHLFEPFFTTKAKGTGTGLGLPVAYGIVRQAGGHITVESVEGKGTTVTVYFPSAST